MKDNKFLFKVLATALISVFIFTGCGSKKDGSSTKSPAAGLEKNQVSDNVKSENGVGIQKPGEKSAASSDKATENKAMVDSERKIIKKGNTVLETLKFEESLNSILKEIETKGGYIESSNVQGNTTGKQIYNEGGKVIYRENRNANITARVPKDAFDEFINGIGDFGNVISKSISGEDVTSQYFDTEARLKTLKIQEERILDLLKKSGELKDIIELEKRLSELRYEIESLTGTLKKLESMVSYSQVTINLLEVVELTPEEKTPVTLGEKILTALKSSTKGLIELCKGFLILIATILPYAVVIGAITLIVIFIKRKFNLKFTKFKNPFNNKK